MRNTYRLINLNVLSGIWLTVLFIYLILHGIHLLSRIGQSSDLLGAVTVLFLAMLNLIGVFHFRKHRMDDLQNWVPWSVTGFWFVLCWIGLLVLLTIFWIPILVYFILIGAYISLKWIMQRFFHRDLPLAKLWKPNTLRTVVYTPATHVWPRPEDIPASSTISLSERFAQWQALSSVKPVAEEAIKIAGEEGERAVLDTLQKHRSLKGEPPRVLWRLYHVTEWSQYDDDEDSQQDEQIFYRSA